MVEFAIPAWAQGPVLHVHVDVDEALYVIAGRLDVQLGKDRLFASAGDFVWMPRRVAHGFSCAGDDEARAVALAVPGGLELLFRDQAAYLAASGGRPDAGELERIGRRHGAQTLGPGGPPPPKLTATSSSKAVPGRPGRGRAHPGEGAGPPRHSPVGGYPPRPLSLHAMMVNRFSGISPPTLSLSR